MIPGNFISHEKDDYCTRSQMVCPYNVTGCTIRRYAALYYAQSCLWVFSRDHYVKINMKQEGIVYSKRGLRGFHHLISSSDIRHACQHKTVIPTSITHLNLRQKRWVV
jgi:hypothetical protein